MQQNYLFLDQLYYLFSIIVETVKLSSVNSDPRIVLHTTTIHFSAILFLIFIMFVVIFILVLFIYLFLSLFIFKFIYFSGLLLYKF